MNILPVLRGETVPAPRNLFWCSGSQEGWWAVRNGDWKLVGDKENIGLFDLSKDVSEKNNLARQMPEKVAELTKLHDAWLAEMANPIKGEAKRYGMDSPAGSKAKKPKSQRKHKSGSQPIKTPESAAPSAVHQSFASLPPKPWKAARGSWKAKDGALWVTQKAGDSQEALLRGPAAFRNGLLGCELNLAAGSHFTLRFKEPGGDSLLRTDLGPDGLSLIKLTGDRHDILKKVPLKLAPTLDAATFIATDAIFDQEKSEVNFLVSDGGAGFRNFSLTPVGSPDSAAK